MKLSKKELQVFEWTKKFYGEPHDKIDRAHDFSHILRVLYNTHLIQKKEGGNLRVLIPAVFLHDIGQAEDDSSGQTEHAMLSAKRAPEILSQFDYSAEEITKICETIELHSSRYSSTREMTLEGKIIFDADKIDAVGKTAFFRWARVYVDRSNRFVADQMLKTYEKWINKLGQQIFYTKRGAKIGQKQLKESINFAKSVVKEEDQMEIFFKAILW
jgi:HD superfamily phosphodiesterase